VKLAACQQMQCLAKPFNLLLTAEQSVTSGVANLFTHCGAGGSQGWQAYEQLVCRSGGAARQSRAVDVFSYGLLLHYCLTGGQHPFGARYERDMNILQVRLQNPPWGDSASQPQPAARRSTGSAVPASISWHIQL
jgi:hypothetical protein